MPNELRPQFLPVKLALSTLLAVLIFPLVSPRAEAQDDSQARVVRLSFVEGTVGVLPPDSSEWAEAPINTPIEQSYELGTQKGSFAEVQFEDASTLRLGELSDVLFDRLEVSDSGRRVTRIRFERGYGTLHIFPDTSGEFQVKAGDATVSPEGECEFRIDRDGQALRIEVWSGGLNFSGPLGNVELGQNQALSYAPGSGEPYDIESGLSQDEWDRWVAQRDQAEAPQPQSINPVNYGGVESSSLYGWSDLSNYGSWTYYSDLGYAWFPFATTAWAPYSFGRWVWYPGFGYTWVSSEPWGWLPYHYGQWAFEPGQGWGWVPQSFANWSPALVNWYQGPGWVGWTPQAPANLGGAGIPCPPMAQGCLRALSIGKFRKGTYVTPQASLRVVPQEGRRVRKPDLVATPLAMLPGAPLESSSASSGRRKWQGGEAPFRTFRAGGPKSNPAAGGSAPDSGLLPLRSKDSGATAAAAHPGRSPSSSVAIQGQTSAVPNSHFTRARAPRSSPSPASNPHQRFGGISVVPMSPAATSHPASSHAPVAPHAAMPH